MKTLPIGISEGKGRNKGYRLNRTVRGKEYNFGSFQNLEHALRTNGYINIIVADLKASHEKESILSVDEIREMIAENSLSNVEEITRLFRLLDSNFSHQMNLLNERFDQGMSIIEPEKKSFWERILRR